MTINERVRQAIKNFDGDKDDIKVICTTKKFTRTATGKNWKRTPLSEQVEEITAQNYERYIQAIPEFRKYGYGASCKCKSNNTIVGYMPTIITAICPGSQQKIVISFDFERSLKNA